METINLRISRELAKVKELERQNLSGNDYQNQICVLWHIIDYFTGWITVSANLKFKITEDGGDLKIEYGNPEKCLRDLMDLGKRKKGMLKYIENMDVYYESEMGKLKSIQEDYKFLEITKEVLRF